MNPISLSINVTDALAPEVTEGQRVRIGAWLFVPPDLDPSSRPAVVSLLNGGSYDKRYFHVQVPGQPGYSMAEYLAARGHIVVLPDHLGIGDSDRLPDGFKTTRQVAAAANHAAMEALYARLADGTLAKGLPPVPDFARIGGGHSMGGMQTITQQAQHRTYERVMVLGYTAAGVHLFHEGQSFPAARPWEADHPAYWRLDHASIAESFHWDDVPPEVLRVDEELAVDVPYRLSWESTQSGIVTADAARIEVPVFICLGERDVSPAPRDEPCYYAASSDITLTVLPRSGHCQSFASSRETMYARIDRWLGETDG